MVDEKKVIEPAKEAAKPAPEGGKGKADPRPAGAAFRGIALLWCGACAFSWAATVYVLPAETSWFWKPIAGVKPIAVAAGAAGAAVAFVLFGKLKGAWTWNKPGLGRAARVAAYAGIALLALFGANQLAWAPSSSSGWWTEIKTFSLAGAEVTIRYSWFPAAAFLTTAMIAAHLFLNRDRWTDFLVETQGELRKVSWPATREWIGSSTVVLVVVLISSFFLYFVDIGLSRVLQKLGIGF